MAATVACKVQATPLKAVIVDDEALARGYLREMLRAVASPLGVCGR